MESSEIPSSSSQNSKVNELDQLTAALSGWKEFLNLAQRIFVWEKFYYSYCIAGVVTFLFLAWWYLDASIVTTLASIGILVVTADFTVPSIGSKLLFGKSWDGEEERRFESLCQELLNARNTLKNWWMYIREKKTTNSVAYICAVCGCLFILGLIGFYINNTFLCYLLVLELCLLPGLKHHGYISKLTSKIKSLFPKGKPKKL